MAMLWPSMGVLSSCLYYYTAWSTLKEETESSAGGAGMIDSNLFSTGKMRYCRGERPAVECILCEVVRKSGLVDDLEIYRDAHVLVSANLFPYNPGHLLLAPLAHLTDPRALSPEVDAALSAILRRTLDILDARYSPQGYNIGWNIGDASGASISHLHMHVVPRYHRELGFIDIIGGAKIIVEDPEVTRDSLRAAFAVHPGM
jgi:ATP adenylyltransferase